MSLLVVQIAEKQKRQETTTLEITEISKNEQTKVTVM